MVNNLRSFERSELERKLILYKRIRVLLFNCLEYILQFFILHSYNYFNQ